MRTTRSNHQQAFRGAPHRAFGGEPQHRLGIIGKVAKWVGISLGASAVVIVLAFKEMAW